MAKQTIKQPNGKFAIYSTVAEGFCFLDCDEEEVVEIFVEEASKRAREGTRMLLDQINEAKKAYHQFSLSWEEAKATHNRRFPKEPIA